ncbi:MAG: hypothetical protein ABI306_10305 [Caulobacteraceae bacterium]
MPRAIARGAVACCLVLAGCATPRVLKAPPGTPTMARPATPNPLPAYATPDPGPHTQFQSDPSATP